MKKILLFIAPVIATATPAMADVSGFNAGIHAGLAINSSRHNMTSPGFNPGFYKKSDIGGTGGTVGLNASYNLVMKNNFFIGGDLFTSRHKNEARQNGTFGPVKINIKTKLKYSFGVAAKFGYLFESLLTYARVGYINSYFEMISKSNTDNALIKTNKENVSGLLLGLGIDVPLSEKMLIGFSYDFAIYKKQRLIHALSPTTHFQHAFKQRIHFLNIALKYRF